MSKDGADGLLLMRQNGTYTVAQDEKSSIVWGTPKTAIDLGAAQKILYLNDISQTIIIIQYAQWFFCFLKL